MRKEITSQAEIANTVQILVTTVAAMVLARLGCARVGHFGKKLRAIREDLSLTQGQLGEKAGRASLSWIQKAEKSAKPPPGKKQMAALAAALGMTVQELRAIGDESGTVKIEIEEDVIQLAETVGTELGISVQEVMDRVGELLKGLKPEEFRRMVEQQNLSQGQPFRRAAKGKTKPGQPPPPPGTP